ncbi:MAG: hypothetical protein Q8L39_15305 [Burkholderiales bacterium]|nr:hypothetical protein [Burkholderiales bacterium]
MNKKQLEYLRKDPITQEAVSETGLDMETLMREVSIDIGIGDFDKPKTWPIGYRAGLIQPCHFGIVRDFLIRCWLLENPDAECERSYHANEHLSNTYLGIEFESNEKSLEPLKKGWREGGIASGKLKKEEAEGTRQKVKKEWNRLSQSKEEHERASLIAKTIGMSEVIVRKHINAAGLRKTKPS